MGTNCRHMEVEKEAEMVVLPQVFQEEQDKDS